MMRDKDNFNLNFNLDYDDDDDTFKSDAKLFGIDFAAYAQGGEPASIPDLEEAIKGRVYIINAHTMLMEIYELGMSLGEHDAAALIFFSWTESILQGTEDGTLTDIDELLKLLRGLKNKRGAVMFAKRREGIELSAVHFYIRAAIFALRAFKCYRKGNHEREVNNCLHCLWCMDQVSNNRLKIPDGELE